jgi:glutamyl-tRNA reductase
MSTLAALRLVALGVDGLRIANRTLARAQTLADRFAGSTVSVSAVPLEEVGEHLVWADLVLSAAAADRLLVTRELLRPKLRARRFRPLLCIDLAVPRTLDSQLGSLENVYVKDVDDVGQLVASNVAKRSEEAQRAERIVDSEVQIFARVLRGRSVAPVLAALRQRGDQVAREEAHRTLLRIGASLDEEQGRSVEAMAQAIVNKLLHEPTVRLRAAAEAQETSVLADAAGELFGLVAPGRSPPGSGDAPAESSGTDSSPSADDDPSKKPEQT